MDLTFKIQGSDWELTLQNVSGEVIDNLLLRRKGNQNFHGTMIDDPDGFRQLLLMEHDNGTDKVGDVVIQFRVNPYTKRYMVQFDEEYLFETETCVKKIPKANRSSLDNIVQAVKKAVVNSGMTYANPRRIGGKPIKTHYVIPGWSPQLAEKMMDVYDYVQSFDSIGHSAFLKALQHMPERPARAIFNQMRTPPISND